LFGSDRHQKQAETNNALGTTRSTRSPYLTPGPTSAFFRVNS
jgi:hypothetical protein